MIVHVLRKPLIGTVAANALAHGAGALNIDGCRIESGGEHMVKGTVTKRTTVTGDERTTSAAGMYASGASFVPTNHPGGRWPANILFTHAPGCGDECAPGCPVAALDAQSGVSKSTGGRTVTRSGGGNVGSGKASEKAWTNDDPGFGDTGGASRFFTTTEYGDDDLLPGEKPGDPPFFYSPKANRAEREAGCEGLPGKTAVEAVGRDPESAGAKNPRAGAGRGAGAVREACALCGVAVGASERRGIEVKPCPESADGKHIPETRETGVVIRNHHPTVKPVSVMRWLVRLVTPKNGVVLDPFAGSGTTGVACVHEGFDFIGIEREAEYAAIAEARINHADTTRRRGSP